MNDKIYHIWMLLLERPGEWVFVRDIAYKVDLSRKQVYTFLAKLPYPPVERKKSDEDGTLSAIRLRGDEEFCERLRRALIRDKYKITDELIQQIHDALPVAGWMSVTDLCIEAGCTKMQVSKALLFMDDVEQTVGPNDYKLYRRRVRCSNSDSSCRPRSATPSTRRTRRSSWRSTTAMPRRTGTMRRRP